MDTVGRWMAAYLKQREIGALFTLTGGHIFPLLDGCLDADLRVVDTRHEQAAAFAAEGYALRTGRTHRANGELTYHVLDLMHAFHDASETGRHVDLQSTCQSPAPLPLGLLDGMLDE